MRREANFLFSFLTISYLSCCYCCRSTSSSNNSSHLFCKAEHDCNSTRTSGRTRIRSNNNNNYLPFAMIKPNDYVCEAVSGTFMAAAAAAAASSSSSSYLLQQHGLTWHNGDMMRKNNICLLRASRTHRLNTVTISFLFSLSLSLFLSHPHLLLM